MWNKLTEQFRFAFDNKRYHTWNYHLKNKFGEKIFKIALDGGFDCPNRDGTVAHGGCTFCSAAGVVTSLVIELNQFMYNLKKLKIKCMKNGLKVNISPISKLSQILMPQSKCYEKNTKQHCLKKML